MLAGPVPSDALTAHLRAHLAIHDQQKLDMAVAFLVDGLLGLITWWMDNQPDLPADEVYARFERLAAPGIEPFVTARGPIHPQHRLTTPPPGTQELD